MNYGANYENPKLTDNLGETVVGIVSQLDIVRFLQRKLAMIIGNQVFTKEKISAKRLMLSNIKA